MKDKTLEAIQKAFEQRNNQQEINFIRALGEVEKIREFLGDPSKILGSDLTKHGEIAEHIDVHIGNAKQLIKGLGKRYSLEGVGRTAPEDYIMDQVKVQSKFINSESKTLTAVIDHMEKYQKFGRDGSKYVIPKNYYETIEKIRSGESIEGLSERSLNTIRTKIDQIEKMAGKDFSEVVDKSVSDYKEVQQGVAVKTVNRHKRDLTEENSLAKRNIEQEAEQKKSEAIAKSQPSLNEALKVAAVAAAVEGTIQTAMVMLQKKKNLRDYDVEDWKEVGIVFGKGAGKGAIRGAAVYSLTNYASMSAPLAASFVSASYGVASLYASYQKGEITAEEMVEQGEIICFDTTLNLLGSTIGQALIPIPVLGAVIGSVASNVLGGIIKNELNAREKELIRLSNIRYEENMKRLDAELAKEIEKIVRRMKFMWGLSRMAFNFELNASLRFDASQSLAVAHGLSKGDILQNEDDIDNYFLK